MRLLQIRTQPFTVSSSSYKTRIMSISKQVTKKWFLNFEIPNDLRPKSFAVQLKGSDASREQILLYNFTLSRVHFPNSSSSIQNGHNPGINRLRPSPRIIPYYKIIIHSPKGNVGVLICIVGTYARRVNIKTNNSMLIPNGKNGVCVCVCWGNGFNTFVAPGSSTHWRWIQLWIINWFRCWKKLLLKWH